MNIACDQIWRRGCATYFRMLKLFFSPSLWKVQGESWVLAIEGKKVFNHQVKYRNCIEGILITQTGINIVSISFII